MLPEGAHNFEFDWNVFILNRTKTRRPNDSLHDDWELVDDSEYSDDSSPAPFSQRSYEEKSPHPILYCYNVIHTRRDAKVRRGATIQALTIACRHHMFMAYSAFVSRCLREQILGSEAPEEELRRLHALLNSFDLNSILEAQKRHQPLLTYFYRSRFHIAASSIPPHHVLHLPIGMPNDEVTDASLSLLVRTFREKVMLIYEAILMERRVIFLGHNVSGSTTSRFVLSACLLVAPLFRLLEERAYPYVPFGNNSFLSTRGYIIGVSNPFFRDKEKLWDVIADISTGEVKESSSSKMSDFAAQFDKTFIRRVLLGMAFNPGEAWVRRQFRFHTQSLIDLSLGKPVEIGDGVQHKASNIVGKSPLMHRIVQWSHTRSYWLYMSSFVATRHNASGKIDIEECARGLLRLLARTYESAGGSSPSLSSQAQKVVESDRKEIQKILFDIALNIDTLQETSELFITLGSYDVHLDDALERLSGTLLADITLRLQSLIQTGQDLSCKSTLPMK